VVGNALGRAPKWSCPCEHLRCLGRIEPPRGVSASASFECQPQALGRHLEAHAQSGANATYVLLALVSGGLPSGRGGPGWLVDATRALPVRSLAEALQAYFLTGPGLALSPDRLLVLGDGPWPAPCAPCASFAGHQLDPLADGRTTSGRECHSYEIGQLRGLDLIQAHPETPRSEICSDLTEIDLAEEGQSCGACPPPPVLGYRIYDLEVTRDKMGLVPEGESGAIECYFFYLAKRDLPKLAAHL
jgi:hypothetical protein